MPLSSETPEKALPCPANPTADPGAPGRSKAFPLGIKISMHRGRVQTTGVQPYLRGAFVPPYESTVTANLWRDGAVMLGNSISTNSRLARRTRPRIMSVR